MTLTLSYSYVKELDSALGFGDNMKGLLLFTLHSYHCYFEGPMYKEKIQKNQKTISMNEIEEIVHVGNQGKKPLSLMYILR